jgi:hypothetical protein
VVQEDNGHTGARPELAIGEPRPSTSTLMVGELFALLGVVCWLIASSHPWPNRLAHNVNRGRQ